nr:substrate-binding domain-containing protein [Cryobacterium breve]
MAGPPEWLDAQQRLTGFQEELRSRQLDPRFVETGDWSAASGYRAARALLGQGVTAIFSGNDQMALGALSAAASLGMTVPGDLSIVGFDDVPEAAYYQPALTTVRQDLTEAGRRAVALLLGEADLHPAVDPETHRAGVHRCPAGAATNRTLTVAKLTVDIRDDDVVDCIHRACDRSHE